MAISWEIHITHVLLMALWNNNTLKLSRVESKFRMDCNSSSATPPKFLPENNHWAAPQPLAEGLIKDKLEFFWIVLVFGAFHGFLIKTWSSDRISFKLTTEIHFIHYCLFLVCTYHVRAKCYVAPFASRVTSSKFLKENCLFLCPYPLIGRQECPAQSRVATNLGILWFE